MTEPTHDPARSRFFALHLCRLAGMIVAAVGILLWRSDAIGGYPQPTLGKALLAAGLFVFLVVPALLRKRWRTPE